MLFRQLGEFSVAVLAIVVQNEGIFADALDNTAPFFVLLNVVGGRVIALQAL